MQYLIQYLMGGVSSSVFFCGFSAGITSAMGLGERTCWAAPAELDPNQSVAHATMTEESGLCLVGGVQNPP